ncbi:uncharacterized protein LOC129779971 [Toxorhynchites rutilus septentrionalis]|uniref:uncharacterized protein LOC129779971 n=1 Tax=Toxorhynchites rutilus septentrionalis TaxID=329112 RepID=UPI002479F9C6|nr:uncharacterized protein LOC129779971 [Toxorhynchites rutilus septentrionalis]
MADKYTDTRRTKSRVFYRQPNNGDSAETSTVGNPGVGNSTQNRKWRNCIVRSTASVTGNRTSDTSNSDSYGSSNLQDFSRGKSLMSLGNTSQNRMNCTKNLDTVVLPTGNGVSTNKFNSEKLISYKSGSSNIENLSREISSMSIGNSGQNKKKTNESVGAAALSTGNRTWNGKDELMKSNSCDPGSSNLDIPRRRSLNARKWSQNRMKPDETVGARALATKNRTSNGKDKIKFIGKTGNKSTTHTAAVNRPYQDGDVYDCDESELLHQMSELDCDCMYELYHMDEYDCDEPSLYDFWGNY